MDLREKWMSVVSLRIGEVLLMSGFFTIGLFFTPLNPWEHPVRVLTACCAIFCYILSVYALNSFADYQADHLNPRLAHLGRISQGTYIWLAAASAIAFVCLFGYLSWLLVPISLVAYSTWILYYVFQFKGRPYAGTLIHLVAGVLHFHFGFVSLVAPSEQSLLVSVFFALVLSAGHVNHEILDYTADKQAKVNTTAVSVGPRKAHRNLIALFALGATYGLVVPVHFSGAPAIFLIFPLVSALAAFAGTFFFTPQSAVAFRRFYRVLFALAGVVFCLHKIYYSH